MTVSVISTLVENLQNRRAKIAVAGLGYVGLPVAHAFSRKYEVIGYDISSKRIDQLRQGIDPTGEVPDGSFAGCSIDFTTDPALLRMCSFIVIAVPTPVDRNKQPDLTALQSITATVGANMAVGSIIVFESTVYPGVTENICVPILEKYSGLKLGSDFRVGYSPERINPGDQEHRLQNIVKIVSGSDAETLEVIAAVYGSIIDAGVYRTSSIAVAEAAKVIENTQRDVNIALMNELSIIFHRLEIDTLEVIKAAGTKWNFLKFFPGLVGGHCIGVDPYYLTYKAGEVGYQPEVILAGRRINDNMSRFVAENTVKTLIKSGIPVKGAKILILGLTFKENVGDIRNSRVVDLIRELNDYLIETWVHDPHVDAGEATQAITAEFLSSPEMAAPFDAVVLAVPHRCFEHLTLERLAALCGKPSLKTPVVIDIRGVFSPARAAELGIMYWRL